METNLDQKGKHIVIIGFPKAKITMVCTLSSIHAGGRILCG